MTTKKPKKQERYGCLSKSLEDFLYLSDEKRFEKYGYDVNKYYQRTVRNVNNAVSDLTFAYEKLPKEQREKIDLISHADILADFIAKKRLKGNPKKIILSTKKQLYAIIQSYITNKPLEKLAKDDFDRVIKWLEYLTPKNPKAKGADF